MATTINEEKCLPGYPEEDYDVATTDRVHSSIDDSLTSLNCWRKFSVPGADPERRRNGVASCLSAAPSPSSPLVGDTAVTTMPLQDPLAGESTATTMHPNPENPDTTSFRPPYSYASLIYRAIRDNKHSRMTLSNIYKWMTDNFPYYRNSKNTSWQNSVRHTLSFNKCFVKVRGKGGYWQINPESEHMFVGGIFKRDGGFPSHTQKRKLLPQNHNAAMQRHYFVVQGAKTMAPYHNIAVQSQGHNEGFNAVVQGLNTVVQGLNTVVQGLNTVVQGPKLIVLSHIPRISISK